MTLNKNKNSIPALGKNSISSLTFSKQCFDVIQSSLGHNNYNIVKEKNGVYFHFRIGKVKIDEETGNDFFEIFKYSNIGEESIGGLIFKEVDINIFYISGFEIENENFIHMGLGKELMNCFYDHIGEKGMGFLKDRSDFSPYEKYGWEKEKLIPGLKKRNIYYFRKNRTKEEKIKLKLSVKKFFNIFH